MQIILILTFIFFLSPTLAQEPDKQIFRAFEDGMKTLNGPAPEYCLEEKKEAPHACIKSICGDVDKLDHYQKRIESMTKDAAKAGDFKNLREKFKQMEENIFKKNSLVIPGVKKYLEGDQVVKIDEKLKPLHNLMYFFTVRDMMVAETIDFTKKPWKFTVDRGETRKKLEGLDKKDQDWLMDTYEEIYNKDYLLEGAYYKGHPMVIFYEKKYPGVKRKDALKKEAGAILALMKSWTEDTESIISYWKKIAPDTLEEEIIQKAFQGELLTEDEWRKYVTATNVFKLLTDIPTEANFPVLWKRDPEKEMPKMLKTFGAKHIFEKRMKALADKKNYHQLFDKSVNKCLLTAELYKKAMPTKAQLKTAPEIFEKAKKSITDKFASLFSKHSQKLINEKLKVLELELPMERSAFVDEFTENVERALSVSDKELKHQQEIDRVPNKEKDQFYLITAYSYVDSEGLGKAKDEKMEIPDYEEVEEVSDLCDNLKLSITDFAYDAGKRGIVNMSWFSLACTHSAKGTLYHELGHILSYVFLNEKMSVESSEKYKEALSCLSKKQPKGKVEVSEIENVDGKLAISSGKFTQEDWADLVAAKTLDKKDFNSICTYIDLESKDGVFNYTNIPIYDPERDDVHSTDMFRLLHTEMVKNGKLTPECAEAIKNIKPVPDFKSCI